MPSAPREPLTPEQYQEAARSYHVLTGMLLLEFARHGSEARDQICQNFIARADTMLSGIFSLWEIRDFGDCWILHRALMDRLFHLHALNRDDHFELFEDWSFKSQYEAANRVRSDPAMKDRLEGVVEELTERQKDRYRKLSNDPPKWRRPKAEDAAKDMGLGLLYAYGYDFASTHVHPMANDGQEDFFRLTGLQPAPNFPDWSVVLNNSVLIASMIAQEALNASKLSWRSVVYDAVDGIRQYLEGGSPFSFAPIMKVANMFNEGVPLAQPSSSKEASEKSASS